jgi:alkylation response protein AidB-like acyl-CoA dehydrogenase
MDLNYSAEELAFRDEVRAWLAENLRDDLRRKVVNYEELSKDDLLSWHRTLAKKGWVAPDWPVEWGGTDWNVVQRYIFEEECGFAGTPPIVSFGVRMCAPVLLRFGTEEQKKRFLPRIYNGDDFWVQGYSEPGAGSDLAALKTRAVRDNGHFVVTGQKIWTTLGHYGDWIFCLVRTDPSRQKRQEGISFLLIDMKTPGITVRPIVLLDGGREVNEVFFDEVKVPAENLVHEENKGWTVAKYLLGYERMGTGRVGYCKRELARVKELATEHTRNGRPLIEDPRFRDRLTRVEVELMALEITNMRFLDQLRGGRPPGAEVSLLKIKGTEIQQTLTELMMQAAGPLAAAFRPINGAEDFDLFTMRLAARYCNLRKATIYAGSNEIQRNIIAKLTLGLPGGAQ